MNKNKKTTQLVVLVAAASLALGVVFMGDFLKGGKVALATNNKSFVFCDGSSSATSFTDNVNVGEVHAEMMTATTCLDADKGTLQLGADRKKDPGVYDFFVVWDAPKKDAVATFFVSANNITGVSVLAQSTDYLDGTRNTFSFTTYTSSMNFKEGDALTYAGLTNALGTGTDRGYTKSGALVTAAGFSNVKTVAFKITAQQVGNTAHFTTFTVNWSC